MADASDARQVSRVMTRRAFAVGAAAAAAGCGAWRWVWTRESDGGIPWPLRRVLEWNERVGRAVFAPSNVTPTFPRSAAVEPPPNGRVGLRSELDPAAWRLSVEHPDGGAAARTLTLADLDAVPRAEMVVEFKCVEGWSRVVHWAGWRFLDFARHFGFGSRSGKRLDPRRAGDVFPYVALETPDGKYFVGLDAPSAYHPQTLLADVMNGEPLTPEHGAPLRLVIPVKYGIKSIKRVGTVRFQERRPRDYWAENGYDWYSGL